MEANELEEFDLFDRLVVNFFDSYLEAALDRLIVRIWSESDDRALIPKNGINLHRLKLDYLLARLKAVHDRHLAIHEYQRVVDLLLVIRRDEV